MVIFKKNAEAVAVALSQIFVHDIAGDTSNPKILAYAKEAGFDSYSNDDQSWCALFLNWVLQVIGVDGTKSLVARSFLEYGSEVFGEPQVGDIALFWRVDPLSWQGHVGFYLNSVWKNNVKYIRIISGNYGDQVKIGELPASQLLAFRRITDL